MDEKVDQHPELPGIGVGLRIALCSQIMSRTRRLEMPGAYYHIMNRGLAKQTIVFDHADFDYFTKGLKEISELYDVEIFAYCLMSNHYHLLIRTRIPNLSRAMRHFGHTFTQRVNLRVKRDGPLFRGRFKSLLVCDDSYLLQLVRYIHRNPVKAGIVERVRDYEWSSALGYESPSFPVWLSRDEILSRFNSNRKSASKAYCEFVENESSGELEAFYSRQRLGDRLTEERILRAHENAIKEGRSLPGT